MTLAQKLAREALPCLYGKGGSVGCHAVACNCVHWPAVERAIEQAIEACAVTANETPNPSGSLAVMNATMEIEQRIRALLTEPAP